MLYNVTYIIFMSCFVIIHHVTLHYITKYFIALHYITLHYITLRYCTVHYTVLCYISQSEHSTITGPAMWGSKWPICRIGKYQSPIDIKPERLLYDPKLSGVIFSNEKKVNICV